MKAKRSVIYSEPAGNIRQTLERWGNVIENKNFQNSFFAEHLWTFVSYF